MATVEMPKVGGAEDDVEPDATNGDMDGPKAHAIQNDEPPREKLGLCQLILKQFVDFKNGLSMTGGDIRSMFQLFFDNLSTLLGTVFAIQNLAGSGAPIEDINDVVWARIVPGVGLSFFLGNIYYSWQAIRVTNTCGRPYTAQPYGLNTPAAFAFIYNIMYPIYFSLLGQLGGAQAFEIAYKTALAGNFVTGAISCFLGLFGTWILNNVPPAALLVPIAGIGVAFLGLAQASYSFSAPIVGYSAVLWVFIGWFSGVRINIGRFRCPEALQVILIGCILGWITGYNEPQAVKDAAQLVRWYGPYWSAGELFDGFRYLGNTLGIVIPIGISACATSLMCLVSAKNAGDPYPVRESMVADGIGTMFASFLGSPFGTVIYIGHPAYKKSGALVGYSLGNGCLYLILSWFGILALMQSIVNQATIGPIVLFVGLMVNEEALHFIPRRHYSAYVIGIFPSLYDWAVTASGRSPLEDNGGNINLPGTDDWFGVLAWKYGALLVSFVWVYLIVMVIDRKWLKAFYVSLIGAFLSAVGVIHVPVAGFDTFTEPTWTQCEPGGVNCWPYGIQWMYMTAYLILGAYCIIIEGCRRYGIGKRLLPEIEDEEHDDQGDWFAEARTVRDEYKTEEQLAAEGKHKEGIELVDNDATHSLTE